MPSSCDECPAVTDEEMACTVLNRFVGIPEQTYEDFLTTFTYLPQEKQDRRIQTDEPQNHCSVFENIQTRKNHEVSADREEKEEMEQLIISEGENVGCCHSLTHSGRVQVDNFINTSDTDALSDDEETRPHFLLYPGEADTETSLNDEPIMRSTCLDIQTSFQKQTTPEEHLDDEIQPFALDQSFDYDCVALTPKFSAVELDFLKNRGHQKTEDKVTEEQNLTAP
ncbi:intraflagellar transport-associated protein [Rana temporaria]|uniref:intraflagellar transport-associated protein n=1 Tax=Rana temporaria TaxID=8407 RepID=UPI001AAD18D4|nr:intraflagellar transport-associated protein [Rana temporaria]